MQAAPPSSGRLTAGLWGSSDGKINPASDASLDIDAFLDGLLMRDPVSLSTELVPASLAQGLGLATDLLVGQQGSNGRKQGSGNRLTFNLPRRGAPTPTTLGGGSGSVPQAKAMGAGQNAEEGARAGELDLGNPAEQLEAVAEVGGQQQEGDDDLAPEVDLAQKQAAAAGAAAAQAAYAHQQQQAANAMAAAAQAYSQQQAAYAHQTQQAALVAAANHPVTSQRQYMHQAQQAQAQAQAQHAAYMQAYQQQAAAQQAQAAAYAAATGQYPSSWMPYGYSQYYAMPQQYMQYPGQYSSMPSNMPPQGMQQGASLPHQAPTAQPVVVAAAAGAAPQQAPSKLDTPVDVEDGEEAHAVKRPRLIWTESLHKRFLESVDMCGGLDHALPKAIMKHMGVNGLTRENVASHLQKYRMRLKKEEEENGDGEKSGAEEEGDGGGGRVTRQRHERAAAAAAAAGREDGVDVDKELPSPQENGKEEADTAKVNNADDAETAAEVVDAPAPAEQPKKTATGGSGNKRKAFEIAQAANNSAGTAI